LLEVGTAQPHFFAGLLIHKFWYLPCFQTFWARAPFSPTLKLESSWNRTQFAAMRSDPRNHETTLAVSITSLFLVCCGTSRDMIHFLGPPFTCVVPVGPQKVTCKVHLKAKARERSSSRIPKRGTKWVLCGAAYVKSGFGPTTTRLKVY